jgi:membrane-bound metal-dependent hydrolase YbcI (DUF457 family)
MPFPPAHMLVGAAMADMAHGTMRNPPSRGRALLAGAALGALPDVDIILGALTGRSWTLHGTFTHSIAAVVVWALIGHALGGERWAAIFGVAYASHLLLDLLDESGPTNLMLGWSFTGQRPYSIGKLFPKVPLEGNGIGEALWNVLSPGALHILLVQTAIAAGFAAALALAAAGVRRSRVRRARPAR